MGVRHARNRVNQTEGGNQPCGPGLGDEAYEVPSQPTSPTNIGQRKGRCRRMILHPKSSVVTNSHFEKEGLGYVPYHKRFSERWRSWEAWSTHIYKPFTVCQRFSRATVKGRGKGAADMGGKKNTRTIMRVKTNWVNHPSRRAVMRGLGERQRHSTP